MSTTNYRFYCCQCGHHVNTTDMQDASTGKCVMCRVYPVGVKLLTQWDNGTVELYRTKEKRFLVRYGEQVQCFRKDQDLNACKGFGLCVRHALECEGKL